MADVYDLAIIGAGSGGIACAQRAAEYGARVIVMDPGPLGGTCVNVGCVPKKVMWNAANLADGLHDAAEYGFHVGEVSHDWAILKRKRDAFILRLNGVYERNLSKRNVEWLRAVASFTGPHTLEAGGRNIEAKHIVIATGGRPMVPPIPGCDLGITSDGFFELEARPQRVAIVGSGYVAVELGGVLASLGSKLTLILRGHALLKDFDDMLGIAALRHFAESDVEIVSTGHPASLARAADGGGLRLSLRDGRELGPFDAVLWAIGRVPRFQDLNLSAAGVEHDVHGYIRTDKFQTTNVPGVYAIGDISGRVPLTPVAIAAGRRLSDRLFGGRPDRHLNYDNVPTVIFSHPPIGTVGLSEAVARERHGDAVQAFVSRFVPLYHGIMSRRPLTEMKLVTVGPEQRIVGAHVIGPGADEMLQGFAVAVRMGATKRDFDDTVAIHPTNAEEFVTMR